VKVVFECLYFGFFVDVFVLKRENKSLHFESTLVPFHITFQSN
jgi:hypothetical protein